MEGEDLIMILAIQRLDSSAEIYTLLCTTHMSYELCQFYCDIFDAMSIQKPEPIRRIIDVLGDVQPEDTNLPDKKNR